MLGLKDEDETTTTTTTATTWLEPPAHSLQDVDVVNDFSEPPRSDTVCLDLLGNVLHVHSFFGFLGCIFWFLGLILIPALTFSYIYVDLWVLHAHDSVF